MKFETANFPFFSTLCLYLTHLFWPLLTNNVFIFTTNLSKLFLFNFSFWKVSNYPDGYWFMYANKRSLFQNII